MKGGGIFSVLVLYPNGILEGSTGAGARVVNGPIELFDATIYDNGVKMQFGCGCRLLSEG